MKNKRSEFLAKLIFNFPFIAFLGWFLVSWIDVAMHNTSSASAKLIGGWNLFVLLF